METKSHVKKLFSQTVIYGFGIILNKSVNFILLPIYTRYFPPEEIGLFTLIQSISLFLGIFYTFGVETSFMKFFIDAKDVKTKSYIYSSALSFLTVSSLILSLLFFLNAENIASLFNFYDLSKSKFLLQVLSVLMLVDTIYRFPLLLFRAELDSKTYAYVNLLTFVVNILCNIFFIIILEKGIESIFYSYIISVTVTFFVALILTKKYLILIFSIDKIKELLKYGNKFVYIGICIILIDMSDRFFLKYFFNESIVGIYWANYRLATVMSLVIAAFKFSWTPYFFNLSSNPDNKKIISTVFTYFVFAGLTMFLVFSVFMEQLVKIRIFGYEFLNVDYWQGLSIVPVVLLAYFFSGVYSIFNAAPFFTNNTRSILIITVIGLSVNIIFNFLLIPPFKMTGAALSTLITYLIMLFIIYFYSQKIYRINYEWEKILKLGVLTLIFFTGSYFIIKKINTNSLSEIAINLALVVFYFFLVNFLKIIELKRVSMLWKK